MANLHGHEERGISIALKSLIAFDNLLYKYFKGSEVDTVRYRDCLLLLKVCMYECN